MALIDLVNGRIELTEEDPHRDKVQVRLVPGRKWDEEKRVWHVPLSWASCVMLRGVFGKTMKVGPALTAWSKHELTFRVNPSMVLRDQLVIRCPGCGLEDAGNDFAHAKDCPFYGLYPPQVVGAQFLTVAGDALLADQMGTGKTVQAIAALKALHGDKPTLVVCPNAVKRTWLKQLAKWWPSANVVVYRSGKAGKVALEQLAEGEADVFVVNWENTWRLSRLAPFGSIKLKRCIECDPDGFPGLSPAKCDVHPKPLNTIEWSTVIIDEAHRAKEPQAKQTRAVWSLGQRTEHRFALTGTPVANSPRDLWSIMHFVAPDEFPAYTRFVDRYGLQSWNERGGLEVVGLNPQTKEELFRFLDPRMLRRPKEVMLPWLPPKLFEQRDVILPTKQRKAYDALKKEMLFELENGELAMATSPMTRALRFRQLALAFVEVEGSKWTLVEPSGKLDELERVLEELDDQQTVIFAEFRDILELTATRFEKKGLSYGAIMGGITERKRDEYMDLFEAGKIQHMLVSLGAGGEGLDGLQCASYGIFLQRSYSLLKDTQAEDRLHRDGQKDNTTIIDIVAEDTIESRIPEVLGEKYERLEEVVRDKETLIRLLGG